MHECSMEITASENEKEVKQMHLDYQQSNNVQNSTMQNLQIEASCSAGIQTQVSEDRGDLGNPNMDFFDSQQTSNDKETEDINKEGLLQKKRIFEDPDNLEVISQQQVTHQTNVKRIRYQKASVSKDPSEIELEDNYSVASSVITPNQEAAKVSNALDHQDSSSSTLVHGQLSVGSLNYTQQESRQKHCCNHKTTRWQN